MGQHPTPLGDRNAKITQISQPIPRASIASPPALLSFPSKSLRLVKVFWGTSGLQTACVQECSLRQPPASLGNRPRSTGWRWRKPCGAIWVQWGWLLAAPAGLGWMPSVALALDVPTPPAAIAQALPSPIVGASLADPDRGPLAQSDPAPSPTEEPTSTPTEEPTPTPTEEPTPPPTTEPIAPKLPPRLVPPRGPVRLSAYLLSGTLAPGDYEDRPPNWPMDTLVLHHTALSASWPPERVAASWQNDPAEVSAHFVVGGRGEILMTVPPSKTAFHILKQAAYVDPETRRSVTWINTRSIGIEFNYNPTSDRPSRAQVVAGGRLIGALFEAYPDLDVRRIIGHGVQSFADGTRGRGLTEPTFLFLDENAQVAPNLLLLLTSAAEVSAEIRREIEAAGGVDRLAAALRRQTIEGRQRTQQINSDWRQPSGLRVSPIDPAAAIQEAQTLNDLLLRPRP